MAAIELQTVVKTFANAVRLWGTGNPGFFAGTAVQKEAAEVIAAARTTAGAR